MVITGNAGTNLLRGSDGADTISGLGGNDTVFAGFGADRVLAGAGNDTVWGGEGGDTLGGGTGDDLIFGFGSADTDPASAAITVTTVGTHGFDRPVFAASAPGDPGRLFVVEQHSGRIVILDTASGAVAATPFLDMPDASLAAGSEQGLLGLAFHPDYAVNGRLFVHLTRANGDVEIRAYQRSASDPDRATGGDTILVIDKDNGARNHNGGWIGFGPDGYLYVAVGDEGGAGDPDNNAQSRDVLWGKLLRLDVDGDDFAGNPSRDYAIPDDNPFADAPGLGEIWALGLRNPWRNGFDRQTGDLYIADVGQAEREEINFQPAGSPGGVNYGWKVKEGELVFDDGVPGNPAPDSPALTDPVASYGHDAAGGFAVVGGYVYRGSEGGLQGRYVYADFVSEQLWSLRIVDGRAQDVTKHTAQIVSAGGSIAGITSFAEDGRGVLYAIGIGGTVSRLDFGTGAADGDDSIAGHGGNDRLFGGAGRDTLDGGGGLDDLYGGAQGDLLRGGGSADRLWGQTGGDYLDGGAGNDRLSGGADSDTFFYGPLSGADIITDFADADTLRLGDGFGFGSAAAALSRATQVGDDVVFDFGGGRLLTVLSTSIEGLADDLIV
jgi:glucose/arabinose dehydrogenase